MIRAACHTADNALALEFDATPWFREADPQSILHLAAQDWSSVWIADALETRPGYEGLHQLVAYAATRLGMSLWRILPGMPSPVSSMHPRPRNGSQRTGRSLCPCLRGNGQRRESSKGAKSAVQSCLRVRRRLAPNDAVADRK